MKSRSLISRALVFGLGIPWAIICIIAFCGFGFLWFGSRRPPKIEPLGDQIPIFAVDSEREAYLAKVSKDLTNLEKGATSLANLMEEVEIEDARWSSDMALQIQVIQTNYRDLTKTPPPKDLEAFHATLLKALSDCNTAAEHLAKGLDILNVAEIHLTGNFMTSCQTKMDQLKPRLQKLIEE